MKGAREKEGESFRGEKGDEEAEDEEGRREGEKLGRWRGRVEKMIIVIIIS